jgi:hypothetical protein
MNKLTFKIYDLLLVVIFHCFGRKMSGDLFDNVFNENMNWKFHKGRHIKRYSKLYTCIR